MNLVRRLRPTRIMRRSYTASDRSHRWSVILRVCSQQMHCSCEQVAALFVKQACFQPNWNIFLTHPVHTPTTKHISRPTFVTRTYKRHTQATLCISRIQHGTTDRKSSSSSRHRCRSHWQRSLSYFSRWHGCRAAQRYSCKSYHARGCWCKDVPHISRHLSRRKNQKHCHRASRCCCGNWYRSRCCGSPSSPVCPGFGRGRIQFFRHNSR